MTKEEFVLEAGRLFEENSEPAYVGASKRAFSQDQKKKFLETMWAMKSIHDKVGDKERLVKELVKRSFDCEQDRVDFILAFLA